MTGDKLSYLNAGPLQVGDDINGVRVVKWLGVDPQTGNAMFDKVEFDADGNPVHKTVNKYDDVFEGMPFGDQRNAQFQYIGSTTPKYYGGLINSFSYKNVSLSVLLNFAYGYLVNNNLKRAYFTDEGNEILRFNQIKPAAGQVIWQKPGDIATEPKRYRNRTDGTLNQYSSRNWEDASHIRVRNIRLGYDLPPNLLKAMKLRNMNIYASGDNLFVFTKKSFYGLDPEGGLAGEQNPNGIGSGYGASRKFLFGVQVTF
ncbi:hypothetical protein D3C80_1166760 [compost metagenome]